MAQAAPNLVDGEGITNALNYVTEKPSTITDSQSARILRKGDLVRILDS